MFINVAPMLQCVSNTYEERTMATASLRTLSPNSKA